MATPGAGSLATASATHDAVPVFAPAAVRTERTWHTIPDAAFAEPVRLTATFDSDPSASRPYARLASREIDLRQRGSVWTADIPLDGVSPGTHAVEVRLRALPGEPVAGHATVIVSQPEYAVWTLDFEGDAASDLAMSNAGRIADALVIPAVVMWNPRVWTTTAVTPERAAAMLAWTKARGQRGDEVALHLHMWTDFARAAGVTPRTAPSWSGRTDGYDVPMYAFDEGESRALLRYALQLMREHGLERPTSFRAASYMVRAHNLRAIAAEGFTADASVAPAGAIGRLAYPWSLPDDAQPYRPAPEDPQRPGGLPLLLSPTHVNTYGHSAASIGPAAARLRASIASAGVPATERRTVHVVSHPGTVDAVEGAAIRALLSTFDDARYDRDAGPLRFVTLAQLARAYSP